MFLNKSLKSLSILSLAITSIPSYATTTVTPSVPNNHYFFVSVPNLRPGIKVSGGAVWLKPGASNLNYVIYNKELPTQSPSWAEREVRPSFSPGFELGLRYSFPHSAAKDIALNWTHLSTSDSASTAAPDASYFLGPDYEIGPLGLVIRNATGKAKFNYDVVNLDVGQYISFCDQVQLRFFGGLSAGFLREDLISTYVGTKTGLFAGPFSTRQDSYSNFTGVGPRAGIHADFNAGYGFGFLGEAAVSALIGSLYSRTDFTSSAVELFDLYGQTINKQTINDQRVYQVIPGLDTKLGIQYKYAFNNCILLTAKAGYQAAVYTNAISQYLPGTLVAGEGIETGGIFVATMSHRLSNYSVQGPFLNLSLLLS
ncbi:MAG: Lpg1974 family pore-forming outer membrane protein [Gammaproteobacteria bacterium]